MAVTTIAALRRDGRHEEALALGLDLLRASPGDARLHFEVACLHDYQGHEAQAVPHYEAALAGPLDHSSRRDALLGLGSTLRVLGLHAQACEVLSRAVEAYPDEPVLKVFLAMALHNVGRGKTAVELLLGVVADNSADGEIRAYRRAIELYARDVDRIWP
jgi:tetratricopeptide (TPR) repeat protein